MGEIELPIHVELGHMIYWKVGVRGFKFGAQADLKNLLDSVHFSAMNNNMSLGRIESHGTDPNPTLGAKFSLEKLNPI